jgi:MFS family permease
MPSPEAQARENAALHRQSDILMNLRLRNGRVSTTTLEELQGAARGTVPWRAGVVSSATRRRRTLAVALLVIAGSVNYLDRSAVSVGNPEIRSALHLSFTEMGLLLSAFAWAYGLAQIPAGAAVDRFGPRRTLGLGLVLWSVAQIAAGFVASLGQFIAARVALGLGESPMYIGGTRVCADWYPLKSRALPIGIFNSSSALAPALAPPLLTLLMLEFGWRAMFILAGAAGFAIALAWITLYRDPAQADVPAEDIAIIQAEDAGGAAQTGFAQVLLLLRYRTTWGMFLGFFGVVYLSWLYATWLPGYLETQRHLSVASAGIWSSVPLAAGFLGALAGGFISDKLGRAGLDASAACRLPIIAGLVMAAACTVAGALAGNTGVAIALMAGGLFGANVASSCGWALAAVVAPGNCVATLEAIQNIGGSAGGSLAPFITGAVVQATGSFVPAFLLAGGIAVVCAGCYWLMAGRRIKAG